MKKCLKCQSEKAKREFYDHPYNRDGKEGTCIACRKAQYKKNYDDYYKAIRKSRYVRKTPVKPPSGS